MLYETPVIFRRDKDGDVIALLPTLPGELYNTSCKAYSPRFGWFNTDTAIMKRTEEATPEEYTPILAQLVHNEGIYPIKIAKRIKGWMDDIRVKDRSILVNQPLVNTPHSHAS